MKLRGWIALSIVFALALGLLVGCQSQGSEQEPPAAAKAAVPPAVAGQPPVGAPPVAGAPPPPVPNQPAAPINIAPPPEPVARDAPQANPRVVNTQNPFVQLVPEAAQAPGPNWLREGTRITYDVKSATIPRDRDDQGASGGGLIQVDVVGIDNLSVASSVKLYLDIALNGTYHPNIVAESYGLAGAGEYWVNPTLLKNIERVANNEMVIVRTPTNVGGRTYQAVRFEYTKGTAKYVWMLDEASGVLLYHSSLLGTDETARKNSSIITLIGVRQLTIPWAGSSIPAWVAVGSSSRFDGSITVAPMGTYPQTFPFSVQAEVKSVAKRWAQYQYRDNGPFPSLPSNRVTGVAQVFDAMWLPQPALQTAAQAQLDRDPVTGSTISVTRNSGMIVITETGRAYRAELGYDERDGGQVFARQETNSGIVVTTIQLQRSRR